VDRIAQMQAFVTIAELQSFAGAVPRLRANPAVDLERRKW
jgi:hypothetical protein